MIVLHPESDMKLNLMVLGADIIKLLRPKKNETGYRLIESVLNEFLELDNKRTLDLFVYSLVFLFSIGLIEQKGYKIKLVPQITEQQIKLPF